MLIPLVLKKLDSKKTHIAVWPSLLKTRRFLNLFYFIQTRFTRLLSAAEPAAACLKSRMFLREQQILKIVTKRRFRCHLYLLLPSSTVISLLVSANSFRFSTNFCLFSWRKKKKFRRTGSTASEN